MYSLEFNGKWKIWQLPPGALFRLGSGDLAVKTQYRTNDKSDCYLLDSGEACHAPEDTEVIMLSVVPDGDAE